jgi:hypothetical protein
MGLMLNVFKIFNWRLLVNDVTVSINDFLVIHKKVKLIQNYGIRRITFQDFQLTSTLNGAKLKLTMFTEDLTMHNFYMKEWPKISSGQDLDPSVFESRTRIQSRIVRIRNTAF